MLAHHLRSWPNIGPTLSLCFMCAGYPLSTNYYKVQWHFISRTRMNYNNFWKSVRDSNTTQNIITTHKTRVNIGVSFNPLDPSLLVITASPHRPPEAVDHVGDNIIHPIILKQLLMMTSILFFLFCNEVVFHTDHDFIFYRIFRFSEIFFIHYFMNSTVTQTNFLYT